MHSGYGAHHIREIGRVMVSATVGVVHLNSGAGSTYYRVIEIVTPHGHYIEHEGLYTSLSSAIDAAEAI